MALIISTEHLLSRFERQASVAAAPAFVTGFVPATAALFWSLQMRNESNALPQCIAQCAGGTLRANDLRWQPAV